MNSAASQPIRIRSVPPVNGRAVLIFQKGSGKAALGAGFATEKITLTFQEPAAAAVTEAESTR